MDNFSSYVTSSAFNLSLSKNMIQALFCIEKNTWLNTSCLTFQSLKRRGLVEVVEEKRGTFTFIKPALTRPGTLVLELCKIAGFNDEYTLLDKSNEKAVRHG